MGNTLLYLLLCPLAHWKVKLCQDGKKLCDSGMALDYSHFFLAWEHPPRSWNHFVASKGNRFYVYGGFVLGNAWYSWHPVAICSIRCTSLRSCATKLNVQWLFQEGDVNAPEKYEALNLHQTYSLLDPTLTGCALCCAVFEQLAGDGVHMCPQVRVPSVLFWLLLR